MDVRKRCNQAHENVNNCFGCIT